MKIDFVGGPWDGKTIEVAIEEGLQQYSGNVSLSSFKGEYVLEIPNADPLLRAAGFSPTARKFVWKQERA